MLGMQTEKTINDGLLQLLLGPLEFRPLRFNLFLNLITAPLEFLRRTRENLLSESQQLLTCSALPSVRASGWKGVWKEKEGGRYIDLDIPCECVALGSEVSEGLLLESDEVTHLA